LSEVSQAPDLRSRILQRFSGTEPQHELADWRLLGAGSERTRRLQKFFPDNPVPAAVLFPLVDRPEGLTVLLTQRASQLAHHAAQISFPGGRLEATDASVADAALRETHEEIGLDAGRVQVFGYLPDHLVISGFRVTPVLGLIAPPFSLQLNSAEVAGVFEVPLTHVLDSANHKARMRRVGDEELLLYDIPWEGQNIWGATAGMLLTFARMLREPQ
jgi:8-oxo-dGTP pyrophosphatase MutT (NUDIX family)